MNTSNESSVYYISTVDILGITSTSINLVLGVPINSYVLWLILTGATGPMASEIFVLNLSVCEIVFSLLSLPAIIKNTLPLLYFTIGFLVTGRPVFQSCICVERFMAVVHPVLFLKYKPLRYRAACSASAWLLIFGASVAFMLLGGRIKYYIYLGEFLFFMSVMLLCSLAILRALRQPAPGETGRDRERGNSIKRRAFYIVCLIMVSFLGNYCMLAIDIIIAISRGHFDENSLFSKICVFVSMVLGLVQPLLYLCNKTGKLPCLKPIQGA